MSLASLLSIARSALLAHQRAMAVTAHNVANANTPGFSRQRLNLTAATPEFGPFGTLGRGVTDTGVTRARDTFMDAAYRRESSLFGGSGTLLDHLGRVEAAMEEPSDYGVTAALDGLFNSFSDLANDPPSGVSRDLTRQAAQTLIQRLHQLDGEVSSVRADAVERMKGMVDQVNTLTRQIADMNAEILAAGGPGQNAADLQDQRDLMVDQLSSLMNVRVLERQDGTIGVIAGDALLVDGSLSQALDVKTLPGGTFGVGMASAATTIGISSGSLAALLDLTNTKLPSIQARLDTLAQSLVTEVNAIHRTGYNALGATNVDFFDPAGVTARTIQLSAAVAASPQAIAAGVTNAAGDGDLALRLAGLSRTNIASLGGTTLREYYVQLAASVGIDAQNATNDNATQQALLDHADLMRSSVSGVSVEEEMTLLIGQQQAYSAAARLIKVADEMMQELLNTL